MGHLPTLGHTRHGLRHLNAVLGSQAFGAACQVNQGDCDAIARIRQPTVRDAADGRLIHTSRFSQAALAETLGFE